MLKLKFHTYLITMQNVNTGLYRTFFLQAEAAGQFWGFVSVLPLFSLSKCEVPNFGPLYSKLGELNIQNSLACFTYNIPGTSSSNFIGFWGIDIWADFEGTRPSCTPVHPVHRLIDSYPRKSWKLADVLYVLGPKINVNKRQYKRIQAGPGRLV